MGGSCRLREGYGVGHSVSEVGRIRLYHRSRSYMLIRESRTLETAFAILIAACLPLVSACSSQAGGQPAPGARVTVFEGARLIPGDGSAPIDDSAFIVENNQFTYVGRRADVTVPAGATRVDLSGKTV